MRKEMRDDGRLHFICLDLPHSTPRPMPEGSEVSGVALWLHWLITTPTFLPSFNPRIALHCWSVPEKQTIRPGKWHESMRNCCFAKARTVTMATTTCAVVKGCLNSVRVLQRRKTFLVIPQSVLCIAVLCCQFTTVQSRRRGKAA